MEPDRDPEPPRDEESRETPRRTGPPRGRDLLRALEGVEVSDETLDALEEQVRSRKDSPARIPTAKDLHGLLERPTRKDQAPTVEEMDDAARERLVRDDDRIVSG